MNLSEFPRCGMRLYEGTTSAGLQVFVFPMPGYQTKCAFFASKFGGCDRRIRLKNRRTELPAGIAHFLEHKTFDMPDHNVLERFAAWGASPNAYTDSGLTGYYFSGTEHFTECLEELLRCVITPCFSPESVDRERGIIIQEILTAEDDPADRAERNLLRALFREHPIRDDILGTAESVAEITADTLTECHRSFYTPRNMVLCCAGDVDPEKIMALAEKLVPVGEEAPDRDYGTEEGLTPASVRAEEKMAVSMPVFELGARLPRQKNGEAWAREMILAELGCDLLLGGGSPLYSDMYDRGIINQSFSAGAFDFPEGGVCYVSGLCPDPMAVLGRLTDAAEDFRMDSAARARLERLKRARLGSFLFSLDFPTELPDLQAESFFGGWSRMDYPRLVDSVTPADVEAFLKDVFRPDRLALSVISPL